MNANLFGAKQKKRRFVKVKKSEIQAPSAKSTLEDQTSGDNSFGEVYVALHCASNFKNTQVLIDQTSFPFLAVGQVMLLTIDGSNEEYCFEIKKENLALNNPPQKLSMDLALAKSSFGIKEEGKLVSWKILSAQEMEKYILNKVEITFEQQYLSMRDIDLLNSKMEGMFIQEKMCGEIDGFDIIYSRLERMNENSGEKEEMETVKFGVISLAKTKIEYASLTSKLLFTVEISQEAAQFSNTGELTILTYLHYFDTNYNSFKKHLTTIVFHARVEFPELGNKDQIILDALDRGVDVSEAFSFCFLKNGVAFKDFYKKMIPSRMITKNNFMEQLREELLQFIDSLPLKQNPFNPQDYRQPTEFPYTGNLSYCQNSNFLEAISLFIETYDPIQTHNNLKCTGSNVVCLVSKRARFMIEEYFWRFLKLKLLRNDTQIYLVSFSDNDTSTTPTFLTVDDEKIIQQLRNRDSGDRNNQVPCSQYSQSVNDTAQMMKDFASPLLMDCVGNMMASQSKSLSGNYHPQCKLASLIQQIQPSLILGIREEKYFKIMKNYRGVINTGVPEDNLVLLPNEEILVKFPKYAEKLEQVFEKCGHSSHRLLNCDKKFKRSEYVEFLRFFREERIVRSTSYPEAQISAIEKDRKVMDYIFGSFSNLNDEKQCLRIRKGFSKNLYEGFSKQKEYEITEDLLEMEGESKNQYELRIQRNRSLSDYDVCSPLQITDFFKLSPKNSFNIEVRGSNENLHTYSDSKYESQNNPYGSKGSTDSRKKPISAYLKKVEYRRFEKAYDERWGEFKTVKFELKDQVRKTRIPSLFSNSIKDKFYDNQGKLQSVNPLYPKTLDKNANQLINSLRSVRLCHNFQLEGMPKYGRMRKFACKKGYQYTDYTITIDSITRNIKDISKKPLVFGTVSEFSKSNLHFFHYSFNSWSAIKKGHIIGHKLFFNAETVNWDFLDNFQIELHDSGCEKIKKVIDYSQFKKNAFCLSFVCYKSKESTDQSIFVKWINSLNTQLGNGNQKANLPSLKLENCQIVICSSEMFGKGDHDIFLIEISDTNTDDAICCSMYWISAPSFSIWMLRQMVFTASNECGLKYHVLTYGFDRLKLILEYEPGVIIVKENEEKRNLVLDEIRRNDFIELNIFAGKESCERKLMFNPLWGVWVSWDKKEVRLSELILENQDSKKIDPKFLKKIEEIQFKTTKQLNIQKYQFFVCK